MNPTVEELNEAQAEWMKLDPHADPKEVKRVIALMDRTPKRYVSGHDGKGVCIIDGGPMSMTVSFEQAMETCKAHHGRTDVAWNGALGQWYSVEAKP